MIPSSDECLSSILTILLTFVLTKAKTRLQMAPLSNQALIKLSVLPLQNLSEDSRIQMFCTGLRMDLITDLARFRSFQIISTQHVESLATQADYVLQGMVRHNGGFIQINLQLIQATENRLVWSEKFRDTLENLFKIEEDIIRKIVITLQQNVDYDLLSTIRKRPLADLNAYESWLYGMTELKKGTLEADQKARRYFQDSITQDPSFARAYTGMSLTYFNEWSCLLWDQWEESQEKAIEWALQAVDLDIYDPLNHYILGKCYLFHKQYKKAEHYLRKAKDLNPLNPKLIAGISFCMVYLGYNEEAMRLYQQAVLIDPSKNGFLVTGALVYFENGDFSTAIELGERVPDGIEWIDFKATLAAAYFHLNQLDKMWNYWRAYTVYFQEKIRPDQAINEELALEWMMHVNPYQAHTQHQPFWEFMMEHLGVNFQEETAGHTSIHSSHQFMKEHELWRLSYKGQSVQLPDMKGLYDIARLLERPHESIHCADLMDIKVVEAGVAVLDQKAKRSYEKRLLDIQESLAEAERISHFQEIETLQKEYDALLDQIRQSIGKTGKSRQASSSVEKARSAVTWRIRAAIKKIEPIHPTLAKHLKLSIKTGLFCAYQPEQDIKWKV